MGTFDAIQRPNDSRPGTRERGLGRGLGTARHLRLKTDLAPPVVRVLVRPVTDAVGLRGPHRPGFAFGCALTVVGPDRRIVDRSSPCSHACLIGSGWPT